MRCPKHDWDMSEVMNRDTGERRWCCSRCDFPAEKWLRERQYLDSRSAEVAQWRAVWGVE